MTRWTITGAMRKRLLDVIAEGMKSEGYALRLAFQAMAAEELAPAYWRSDLRELLRWWTASAEADSRSLAVAGAITDGIIIEWTKAHEAADAMRLAIGRLTDWDPIGATRATINPEAIEPRP